MLCVLILYISGGTYSLKSTPNNRFFVGNFSWQFLFTLRVFAKNPLLPNTLFFLNGLKKNYWIFSQISFFMENNIIQMFASAGYAVAYTIGSIFKHIIDCVQLYFTILLHEYCPLKLQLSMDCRRITYHAVTYTIGSSFKHIIDCVQLYVTNCFTNIVL